MEKPMRSSMDRVTGSMKKNFLSPRLLPGHLTAGILLITGLMREMSGNFPWPIIQVSYTLKKSHSNIQKWAWLIQKWAFSFLTHNPEKPPPSTATVSLTDISPASNGQMIPTNFASSGWTGIRTTWNCCLLTHAQVRLLYYSRKTINTLSISMTTSLSFQKMSVLSGQAKRMVSTTSISTEWMDN